MGNEISQSVPPDIVRAADLDEKLDDYRLVADSHHKQDVCTKDASYTKDEANARYRLASDSYTKAKQTPSWTRSTTMWRGSGVLEKDNFNVGKFCFKHKSDPGYSGNMNDMSHEVVACFDHIPAFLDPDYARNHNNRGNFVMISSDRQVAGQYGNHLRMCGLSTADGQAPNQECHRLSTIRTHHPKCYLQFETTGGISTTDQSMHICVKDGEEDTERRHVNNMNFLIQKDYYGMGNRQDSYADRTDDAYRAQQQGEAQQGGTSDTCFAPSCKVRLASGTHARVEDVAKGSVVWTPEGAATVLCVVRTAREHRPIPLFAILNEGPRLSAGHLVRVNGCWQLADMVGAPAGVSSAVYNFVLDRGHIVEVDGVWAATLTHDADDEKGQVKLQQALGHARLERWPRADGGTQGATEKCHAQPNWRTPYKLVLSNS